MLYTEEDALEKLHNSIEISRTTQNFRHECHSLIRRGDLFLNCSALNKAYSDYKKAIEIAETWHQEGEPKSIAGLLETQSVWFNFNLARERAMLAHDHLQAMIAEEQNQRMFILSIVAAIFLPLSFVTGLMGMNVGGIPGSEYPRAFALIVLGMFSVSFGLIWLFRRRRWI